MNAPNLNFRALFYQITKVDIDHIRSFAFEFSFSSPLFLLCYVQEWFSLSRTEKLRSGGWDKTTDPALESSPCIKTQQPNKV